MREAPLGSERRCGVGEALVMLERREFENRRSSMSASPAGARPLLKAVGGGAASSIRHPLARALLALTFSTGLVDAVSYLGLGLGAAIVAATTDVQPATFSGDAVIAMLALAMGVRNATVRRLAVPDLTTTVLTMTLTGLAADSRLAGGSGKGSVRRIAAVLAMLTGALAGALLLKISLVPPLLAAAGIALLVALAYVPFAHREA
jgi:uncharacterized membrane protein YoaK (UPF0700 family)